MMQLVRLGLLALMILVVTGAAAQGFGTVFRAGMNISSLSGPVLMSADGEPAEAFGTSTGFHIGAGARYKFEYSGNYGVSLEFLYSLKGGLVDYNGDSWFLFRNAQGANIRSMGMRRKAIDISTSYIEFPLQLFAKVGKFEFTGGGYMGIRLRTIANGDYTYTSTSPNAFDFTVELDQNFRNDRVPNFSDPFETQDLITVTVAGELFQLPRQQGAYFEHDDFTGSYILPLDFGLTGGVSYYLTEGLFISGRIQYGLTDITRDDMHLNIQELGPNNERLFREEVHTNIVYQVSIGFAF